MEWNDELRKALRRPFPVDAVKWKAQATSKDKTRALAVAFIDARNVMERLDRVIGPGGWSDDFEILASTQNEYVVQCALTILGVTKRDVGDSSAASGSGSNLAKTAYSDALKRAAVKFGVGRYLYALPAKWVGYNAQRKKLTEIPELPKWARPAHVGEEPTKDPGESLPDPEPVGDKVDEPAKKVGSGKADGIAQSGNKQAIYPPVDPSKWDELPVPADFSELYARVAQLHITGDTPEGRRKHAANIIKLAHADSEATAASAWQALLDHQKSKQAETEDAINAAFPLAEPSSAEGA